MPTGVVTELQAGLEYRQNIERLVEAFATLPHPVRPVHFSHEEEVRTSVDRIDNRKRFDKFLARSKSGFCLLAPGVSYSIRIATGKPTICDAFFDVEAEFVKQFLVHMAAADPVFGFACARGERNHRNRFRTALGSRTIEGWVGRDSQRYVPGLYWLTLLSGALLSKHGVTLSALTPIALEHMRLEGGQHLLRFYERPVDWRYESNVTKLIAALPGIFDIQDVAPRLEGAKTLAEVNAITREWR